MTRTSINFGIVGTGHMALRMTQALLQLRGAAIVGVASGTPSRARRLVEGIGTGCAHDDIASLLADRSVDVVYVASANAEHSATVLAALRAGKSVLCEKPLATSVSQAREIEAAARDSGCLAMEAMWTLFLPTYRRFGELVERQRHGGPQHLYADFGYPVLSDHDRRFVARGPGAGVLLDRAVYPFALALKLFGPVESVTGSVDFTSQGVDQHAVVLLRHGAGSQSQIAVSLRVQLQNRVALSSASGLITIEPPAIGAELLTSLACASAEIESDPLVAAGFRARLGNALRRLPSLRRLNRLRRAPRLEHHSFGADPYLPMLTHFCELLRDGKSSSDVMPLSLSTDVLALVELTRQLPGNRTDRAGPRAQSPNDAAIARTTA